MFIEKNEYPTLQFKYVQTNELSKSQEKLNDLMDDIKLFAKNEKELEILIQTVRIYSPDIGMEFGIEKCAMLVENDTWRKESN